MFGFIDFKNYRWFNLNKTVASFQVELQRSRLLTYFIVCTHMLALIACLLTALPIGIKTALITLVLLQMMRVLRSYVIDVPRTIFRYTESKGWELAGKNAFMPIQIVDSTVISTFIIILHFYVSEGRKQSILIPYDALTIEEFRKITVELKISGFK